MPWHFHDNVSLNFKKVHRGKGYYLPINIGIEGAASDMGISLLEKLHTFRVIFQSNQAQISLHFAPSLKGISLTLPIS